MDPDTGDYRSSKRKVRVLSHYTFPSLNPYQLLARDGFRCLVTGNFDERSVLKCHKLDDECVRLGAGPTTIAACHILNEATMQGVDPTGASEDIRVINKVCVVIFSSLHSPPQHHWSRPVTPPLPCPFLRPSDLTISQKNFSQQMVSMN